MNDRQKIILLRALNIAVWLTLLLVIVVLVAYNLPQRTVEFTNFKTEKTTYKVGEMLITSADTEVLFNGQSFYDVRLECDKGRYLLASFDTASTKAPKISSKRPVGAIPVIPTPDHCTVRVQAVHKIEVLPFIYREYNQTIETNRFKVEAVRVHNE